MHDDVFPRNREAEIIEQYSAERQQDAATIAVLAVLATVEFLIIVVLAIVRVTH